MKKLLITLALLSFANSAMANGAKNIKGTSFYEECVDGVAYLTFDKAYGGAVTPKLLPSGKPATCNY